MAMNRQRKNMVVNSRSDILARLFLVGGMLTLAACGGGGSNATSTTPDPMPIVQTGIYSVAEGDAGDTTLAIEVRLSRAADAVATIDYVSEDGTAIAPQDYDSVSGTLTFPAGSTSQVVNVSVHGDTAVDVDESFALRFSNASSNVNAPAGTSTGIILSDDTPTSGLATRPQNLTCVAPARPQVNTSVAVVSAYPALSFSQPTKLLLEPVADPRWFVLQKGGQLVVFDPDNATSVEAFLSVTVNTSSEGGGRGLAVHPD